MEKHPVISIIGGTIWGNRGAESMLVTVIGKLREIKPDTRFNVFSYYPTHDRELIEDDLITILSGKPVSLITRHFFGALVIAILKKLGIKAPKGDFFKIARALYASDLLLDIGGITFSDGREKYLPFNILTIWPAMLLHVPVVKLAQAVGPFRHQINRLCAKLFLFRCAQVFARGEKTAEFLNDLHFPLDCYDTSADIAFLYKPDYSLSVENPEKVEDLLTWVRGEKRRGKSILVFSPSVLVDQESSSRGLNYSEGFFDVIRQLGEESFSYIFIPNATRETSEKTHNNDILAIRKMQGSASAGRLSAEVQDAVKWVTWDINSKSIRQIIGSADALVTSRYHAMISGLALAVPTLVIGWGHKYRETMAYFGLEHYSLDFGEEASGLADIVHELLNQKTAIRRKIKKHLPEVQARSDVQFAYLARVLA
jgi:polysaccharide pyruvyl transferase WcaK-like protein